ncbi:MAG: hypothetical protein K5663_12290 [Clostridiales bacterium]|nr:hypothetical protein [Clostridiales bacterium]
MVKRLLSLLVAVILTFGCLCAFASTDKLEDALAQLNYYLTVFGSEEDIVDVDLAEIVDAFSKLGNSGRGFYNYSYILLLLERGDYRIASIYKKMLENDKGFSEQLDDKAFRETYPSISEVQDLLYYVDARVAENSGDKAEAETFYLLSGGFFDSAKRLILLSGGESADMYERAIALFTDGGYEEAYVLLHELAKYKYSDSADFLEMCGEILIDKGIDPKTLLNGDQEVDEKDEVTVPVQTAAPTATAKPRQTPRQTPRPTQKTHTHSWTNADCTHAKTCKICGATEGKALGHSWKAADCTHAKTCSRCGETEGKALGHNWKAADCTHAKTCTRCKAVSGKALGHAWKAADCTHAKTCSRCGATEGNALGHSWKAATESAPKTCSRCGLTEGNKLTWSSWSSWSSTAVTASSTRQVETRTQYNYQRWHYYNTKYNAWYNHYKKYTGAQYKSGSGEWQYKTTYTPLAKDGTVDGVQCYKGYWYLKNTVKQYRYRDLG